VLIPAPGGGDTERYRPRIAITHGDPNGIGPEVVLKVISDQRVLRYFDPVLVGSSYVFRRFAHALKLKDLELLGVRRKSSADRVEIIDVLRRKKVRLDVGQVTPQGGKLAMEAVRVATDLAVKKAVDAVVTAPISKQAIALAGYEFPGHTEYLAERTETRLPLMMMIADTLRVGLVTAHIPLQRVADGVTKEAVKSAIVRLNQSLLSDFGISRPKVAVLGLNPHAGEGGVLGHEESEEILPAIQQSCKEGVLAFGPFPADGFFGAATYRHYDGVLAMYHDQGLAPFKTLAFEDGVNFTAGLPIVRTSPDHGTAFDIAGRGKASPRSLRQALFAAIDIARHRRETGS